MKHARPDYDRIYDRHGLIPHEEPVFLFRGQDKYAAGVLRFYANLLEGTGCDPAMVKSVRDHAALMDAWPRKKTPDLPKVGPTLDLSKHYRTREGMPIVSLTRIDDHFRVVATTAPGSGNGPYDFPFNVQLDGTYDPNHDYDLIEAPRPENL